MYVILQYVKNHKTDEVVNKVVKKELLVEEKDRIMSVQINKTYLYKRMTYFKTSQDCSQCHLC